MGYHKRVIPRGVYGDFSKVTEEFEELTDAIEQGDKILTLVEISDLYGALEGYIERHHGFTMKDVSKFSEKTKRSFINGDRK